MMSLRDDEDMPGSDGADVVEGDAHLVFIDERDSGFTTGDVAKNAGIGQVSFR